MLYILTPVFCVALLCGTVFSFLNNGNKVYAASTVKSNGAYLNLNGTTNIYNGFEGAQKETIYLGNNNNAPVKWRVLAKNDTKYGSGDNLLLFADSILGTTVYNDTTYWGDYYGTSKLRALLNGGYHVKPNADGDVASVTSYIAESSSYASTLFSGLGDDLIMTAKDIITHDSHFTRAAWFESPKVNPWMRTVGDDLYTSNASDIINKYIVYCTTSIAGKSINTKTGKTADPNFSVSYSVANGIAETTKGDKLFPLDYDDMVNKAYGFVDSSGKTYLDKLGSTYASNYASKGYKYGYPNINEGEVKFAQFKPTGSGSYWLRMAAKVFDSWENGAFYVDANGEISAALYAVESTGALAVQGVRPAFVLDATKLAYVTTATPTAGSGFVNLTTKQTTPTYKTYVKDADFNSFSSSAKGNVKEDNGTLSITYNNPTGETGGNLLVLLSPKSATGGEVDYQATVAMSPTASATKQAATTLALPAEVSLSTHNLTLLYTSATSANATENIYCAYPSDGGIDAPQDFNAGKFNDSSKWIGDLPEGDRPSWWNSDIYGDTPYMSVKSVEYTNAKGVKQIDKTYTTADIKDAGTYKVTFELTSGLKWSGGSTENKSFTITIAQAESSIVPQYANAPTYVPDELPAISLKPGGTEGTIKWDDGQHPQSGTNSYTWTFTPENENNYTTVKDSKSFTFAAREVESVTIKSFDTKGKKIYTNTSVATLKTYMTVEVKYTGIADKVELDPGDYDLLINANNKLVKGENKLKVKYTTSDNKTKYSAEFPISGVEELAYKTITNIVLGNDEFTYPVKASEILAEITSVDVEMNDGSSGELTAEQISTLMVLEGELTVDTTSVTFKIKDTEAETDYPITIKKGDHDLSKIKFEGNKDKIEYDGEKHSIAYAGTLPEGVEAEYTYDGTKQSTPFEFTDAGTYSITLSFKNTDKNYNNLTSSSNLTAELVIDQAEVDMDGVTFKGAQQYADGTEYTLEIKGDLPQIKGIQVTYSVKGQSGTSFKDIGTYEFTAKFTHKETDYY
ncbi:MAG: hypothetical protein K2J61_04445 [Clostridia bacterium]|nr:hypothetical protein [Clostridia bacterium]